MATNIDINYTYAMIRALREVKPAQNFLLDRFMTEVVRSTQKYVMMEVKRGKRKMAPFVSYLGMAPVYVKENTESARVEPPYLMEKASITPDQLLERSFDEDPFTPMSLDQKRRMLEMEYLADIRDRQRRRMEWMVAQQLQNGKFTAVGEGVEIDIDLLMLASHKKVNTDLTANGWDQNGSQKIKDLRNAKALIAQDAGINGSDVYFGKTAWELFEADTDINARLNRIRNIPGTVQPMAPGLGADYQGSMEGFNFYTYNEWYHDEATNTEKPMIDDKYAIVAAPNLEGVELYGAIMDHKSLTATEFFPSMWETDEPSVVWVKGQSKPLPLLRQVNGWVSMKVIA